MYVIVKQNNWSNNSLSDCQHLGSDVSCSIINFSFTGILRLIFLFVYGSNSTAGFSAVPSLLFVYVSIYSVTPSTTVDKLISNLSPKTLVPLQNYDLKPSPAED